ncbi:beta-N-acetylhexosaminidase [Spongiivirga citrea]|uniref:beta-N-acetylhexosaminidase n=1 Tax=Spongiivirga citrea TaxID=1481457 RepID=A0A6M0CEE3_9FLAO|nr:beta-N-acetylhexosaminidase [Spongiivirga citrea]NER16111.1 family 20 glycosylhydrolase [Spongiivirga citrea]
MKNVSTLITCFSLLLFMGCKEKRVATPMDLAKENLIPKPVGMVATGSSFLLSSESVIYTDQEFRAQAQTLAAELKEITGINIGIAENEDESKSEGIILSKKTTNDDLKEEGYELNIEEDVMTISSNHPSGIFNAIQTIKQLLPTTIDSNKIEIASGKIIDYPNYEYRGAMLDVSRHFFSVDDVKQYIDYLAMFKMNVLHLHLSDDQGWRIEIKSWPKLAEIGGKTEVGGTEGGYYTQEDYKEIVQYAADRFITIIPEIDMPGHTNAALASYPELNCDGKSPEPYTGMKVGFSSFCVDKEITYKFIDDVVRELAAISPGKYFHIGGDESHATKKADYVIFVDKVQDIVSKHGKTMVGWDEVVTANIKSSSIAQFWASEDNAKTAVEKNVKLIMSPAKKAYLDMKYDSITKLGLKWAGYVEVDTGYDWNPAAYVEGITKENILGIEAPLWTETVTNMNELQFLVFPRLPGYAEIGWTQDSLRSWGEYKTRLASFKNRFEKMNINYYKSSKVDW